MKKNYHFRKVPNYISEELAQSKGSSVSIVAALHVSKDDIMAGKLKHLGFTIADGEIRVPNVILPYMISGTYARRNKDGYDIVHKNRPKVLKTIWWESPNFGDPSKGYHDNYRDMLVYPRTHIPAREWEISIYVEHSDIDQVKIVAVLNPALNKNTSIFDEDLFFAINLMQEQFRDCHVVEAQLTPEQIAATINVGWEIFPQGTIDQTIERIIGRMRTASPDRVLEIKRRTNILDRFHPLRYIHGVGLDARYFGAMMEEDIVVFENLDYGNAIYILSDNWEELSKLSRIDLLRKHENEFIRIIHKTGWERQLEHLLADLRKKRSKQ